jgi:hypothetical protein
LKIFELSIGGLGSYVIARFLEKQGVPPYGYRSIFGENAAIMPGE